ncbi:ABC transporter [Actinophytocola xinjiangensis]|uniref:Transport permease protein n=1 Tax=Actinophytocola xinjiangensis TaxID=485602 RepID=A0A7Z0WGK4_9PSEU|nr:ABC transporter permease [Actinophytocola xinjiangensis]OLF06751.1 ABC transporter [Actinophytocola xinjiangensis]
MTFVEVKQFLREPINTGVAVGLPTALLIIFGNIDGMNVPDPLWGGLRFIDYFTPSMVVIIVAVLALQSMPSYIANYREKGVLKRLSTTPVSPAMLITAQLLTQLAAAVSALVLLMLVGTLFIGVPLPAHPLDFILSFLLGLSALMTLGLLLAAVVPNGRSATAASFVIFIPTLFFAGVYAPRAFLPDFVVTFGGYFPPSVQALQDSWTGDGANPWHLLTMAAIVVIFGPITAKIFRWE